MRTEVCPGPAILGGLLCADGGPVERTARIATPPVLVCIRHMPRRYQS